jgi:hypothetical protein
MDVVFVLERTANVGAANWASLLKFIVYITNYNSYGSGGARYGLLVFGNGPTNVIYLSNGIADTATLATLIQQTPYNADTGANLYDALVMLRTQQFTAANGDRPNAPNVAVIITTSAPLDSMIVAEANNVKAANIKLVTVGVGAGVNQFTLQAISSYPQQLGSTVFLTASYSSLFTDYKDWHPISYRLPWLATG